MASSMGARRTDVRRPGYAHAKGGTPQGCAALHTLRTGTGSTAPEPAQWPPCSLARAYDFSISASASARPTQSAPSTDLPGSRSL